MKQQADTNDGQGHQRLPIERLDRWRAMDYGMFIHYGLATFTSQERGGGLQPIDDYAPEDLDVEQWVKVARDAGMTYIILTAKHIRDGGFSLWPTKHSDYSVAQSPVKTDVIGEFVSACGKHGIKPAIYIGGDQYNVPGGIVGNARHDFFEVSRAYMDHTLAQLEELLTWYGPLEEIWFDGPKKFGVTGRRELTRFIESHQPETVVAMNGAWENDGKTIQVKPETWPSDVVVIEAGVPPIWSGQNWRSLSWDELGNALDAPRAYYMPVENCTIAHKGSFGFWWGPEATARSLEELLGTRLLCHVRNSNCVFNITPDRRGQIPDDQAKVLRDLRETWESMGLG